VMRSRTTSESSIQRNSGLSCEQGIEFLTALPLTENGKVQKFRLRERGVTVATWDRETETSE
jgi:acyl-coenzyme A synthetase/AMP-(fatty) acid ligase